MSLLHPVFDTLSIQVLSPNDFDSLTLKSDDRVKAVFFWGHQCPNCDVAKRSLLEYKKEVLEFPIDWFHVNVYDHFDLGTRFGLHGIPVFIFFKNNKNLGRVTSFPGIDPFIEVLKKLTMTQ